MITCSQTARLGAALAAVAITVAAGGPSASAQTKFNPSTAQDTAFPIIVQRADGTQVNSDTELVGEIGVEQCKKQLGNRVTFQFQINHNVNQDLRFQQVRVMEFDAREGFQGSCTHNGDNSDCERLFADNEYAWMTPEPSSDRLLQESTVEVAVEFETLMSHDGDETEPCRFVTASQPQAYRPQSGHLDAGDVGGADADAGATADAGGSGDARGDGDAGGDGDAEPAAGADRLYSVRLFLQKREASGTFGQTENSYLEADGALVLDRTRPPRPPTVEAGATENILKVGFRSPSRREDVENYSVVFSSQQFNADTPPEELADRDGIEIRPLSGVSTDAEESGRRTGRVTGIEQEAGDKLYVAVVSRDRADNYSKVTMAERSTIPVNRSVDFWEKYNEAGGAEPGGCACVSTPDRLPTGPIAVLFGLGGLALLRRQRRPTDHSNPTSN